MASPLLTAADVVACDHGGIATLETLETSGRVTVGGRSVALAGSQTTMAPGCSLQAPCAQVRTWIGPSRRLEVEGIPVLLATTKATCQNGAPATPRPPTQHRVSGA